LPELGLIAGTRVALGASLGLLLGDRFPAHERKVLGWTLLLAGVATTIPLVIDVLGRSRRATAPEEWWTEAGMTTAHT
jgi:hypothetical protein